MDWRRSKVLQKTSGRSSLYTFQPTKTRRGKPTHKEVNARHLYLPSGSQPSTPGTPRTMASSQNLNFSDFHDSLDIHNSDWNDVDDAPQSRRYTKVCTLIWGWSTIKNSLWSQNDFIREWLPWRAEYLNVILEGEQLAKGGICGQCCEGEGSVWCMSCTAAHAWCGPCAVKAHTNFPFHKVQRWNGAHYQPTSFMDLGFLWHIGHGGDPCPHNWSDPDPEESGYVTGEGPPNHRLFPASISKPKTAFTFDVLDHFLIDALEYKTSAMSFYQKLKRFTNNAFPERGKIQGVEDLPSSALPAPSQVLSYLQTGKFSMTDRRLDTVMRQYVMDGNFTAQDMKMNKPELDVALSDGKGYMVSEVPSHSHLQQSLDSKEGLVPQLVLGMAALSPTLWWIFKKGRGCQWSVNFRSRVKNSPSLLLPPALEIVPAVGKFHLAAYKLSCFPRYSLNFVKGAGHLDGEILEILWAPFNKISPTARQEVYDDHMRDSNWKKLVGLVLSLLKKYKTSNKCLEEMNQAYEKLTAVLDPDRVSGWELDALRAEADRGEALDIYLLKGGKLQLTKNPKSLTDSVGSVAWLAEGISIEDSQQEVKISEKRQRLSARIEIFHSDGEAFLKGLELDGTFTPQDDPTFCGKEEAEEEEEEEGDREFWDDDEGDWEAPEEEVEELASELMSIWMPSSIGSAKMTELGLDDLLKEERELQIGQANDCPNQLRTDLGNKAMEGTRTKKEIQKVVERVNKHVRCYQRARQGILRLEPDVDAAENVPCEKYPEILPEDLAVSKEVTEENRFGQGSSKLAWFWMMGGEHSQLNVQGGDLMEEFYRINWLKARARRDRWKEEVSLVRHEMLWTCLWFEHHKNMWEKRALQSSEPGKEAYAKKQMGLWSDFAKKARLMFLGKYQEARGNSELRNEILAEVKAKILQHELLESVDLPCNLRVAIRMEYLHQLDPQDQEEEIAVMQHILAATGKRQEDTGEGEDAREEQARPTKAGAYNEGFMAFISAQQIFKEEMDSYDRERRDTKDQKTIGQRTRIVQQWWEPLSDDRKAETGRAAEKWNKLGAPKQTHDS
ncbi:hypothetical protein EDD16DRAFT_1525810 [Pisolithus croceorrhizus]|nr:hypothetical protein EDD16DRAFT_1525810 [Pisolithus croceorrhizus]